MKIELDIELDIAYDFETEAKAIGRLVDGIDVTCRRTTLESPDGWPIWEFIGEPVEIEKLLTTRWMIQTGSRR